MAMQTTGIQCSTAVRASRPAAAPRASPPGAGLCRLRTSRWRRSYYANVAFIDEWVGKIIETLASRSFDKNTFIIWGADHGDGQGMPLCS
jgi:arylsulfatase A-like enzyme